MIAVIGGEEKTGKTTFSLSFPKPLWYAEFDLGGFERAIYRFSAAERTQIVRTTFPVPLQALVAPNREGLTHAKLVMGMRELWYKFLTEFNDACSNPNFQTLVLDTWFQVWEVNRLCVLQEKQESQLDPDGIFRPAKPGEKMRQQLQQIEYGEPNSRMRNLMFYARGMGKHLVLVTYDRDEYKPQLNEEGRIVEIRTGKKIYGGWAETMKHTDIALWTSLEYGANSVHPVAAITLPGLASLEKVGFILPDNSYQTLMQVLEL